MRCITLRKLLAKRFLKPLEGGADGRLPATEPFRGLCDAALLCNGDEAAKQVPVKRVNNLHTGSRSGAKHHQYQ